MRAAPLAGLLLLLALLAAPRAAAEAGAFRLAPGEMEEITVPIPRTGTRVSYGFNTTPAGTPVEFNIHYLKDGFPLYDRPPENVSRVRTTFFPLRAADFFLQFRNWGDTEVRVSWEWHYVRPLPSTRDTPAPELAAAGALVVAALVGAGSGRRS